MGCRRRNSLWKPRKIMECAPWPWEVTHEEQPAGELLSDKPFLCQAWIVHRPSLRSTPSSTSAWSFSAWLCWQKAATASLFWGSKLQSSRAANTPSQFWWGLAKKMNKGCIFRDREHEDVENPGEPAAHANSVEKILQLCRQRLGREVSVSGRVLASPR